MRAERVATLTRDAYRGSDPLPGLPPPDGARDTAEAVLRFVDTGGRVWAAGVRGDLVGALRTVRDRDGGWSISRVAVPPTWRARGVTRWLLDALERRAAAAGARAVRLDAVVERCVPTFYARLGYRVAGHHLAVDDKLLTEVAMERVPATGRRTVAPYPPQRDAAAGGAIVWALTDAGLAAVAAGGRGGIGAVIARAAEVLGDATARLAGVDVWRGAPRDLPAIFRRIREAADRPSAAGDRGPVVYRHAGRDRVPHHLMPRTLHRDLWAALRFLPGAEPPLPHPSLRRQE